MIPKRFFLRGIRSPKAAFVFINTLVTMIPVSLALHIALWYGSAPAPESYDLATVVSVEECERSSQALWLGSECEAEVEWSDGERESVLVVAVNRIVEGDSVSATSFGIVPADTMRRPYLRLWAAVASIGLIFTVGWLHARNWDSRS